MWGYTWNDLLEYFQQLPIDRVVRIYEGMKKEDVNNRYLETVCDKRDTRVKDEELVDFMVRYNKSKEGGK